MGHYHVNLNPPVQSTVVKYISSKSHFVYYFFYWFVIVLFIISRNKRHTPTENKQTWSTSAQHMGLLWVVLLNVHVLKHDHSKSFIQQTPGNSTLHSQFWGEEKIVKKILFIHSFYNQTSRYMMVYERYIIVLCIMLFLMKRQFNR